MRKFIYKLIVLADFSIFKLYGIFAMVWFTEQIVSMGIEDLIYGKPFIHWFDVAFVITLFIVFVVIAWKLAEFKANQGKKT